jgi:fatty acid desaturase
MDNLKKIALVIGVLVFLAAIGFVFLLLMGLFSKYIVPILVLAFFGVIGLAVLYAIIWAIFIHKW